MSSAMNAVVFQMSATMTISVASWELASGVVESSPSWFNSDPCRSRPVRASTSAAGRSTASYSPDTTFTARPMLRLASVRNAT